MMGMRISLSTFCYLKIQISFSVSMILEVLTMGFLQLTELNFYLRGHAL